MKLSEALKKSYNFTIYNERILEQIQQLESDSQMLDDLFEMMQRANIGLSKGNGQWAVDEAIEAKDHSDIAFGSTPRKAIANAVKEWNEQK
jgi:hypothetical protein